MPKPDERRQNKLPPRLPEAEAAQPGERREEKTPPRLRQNKLPPRLPKAEAAQPGERIREDRDSLNAANSPASGWYDAPDGSPRWRFWDGGKWTSFQWDKGGPPPPRPEELQEPTQRETDPSPLEPASGTTVAKDPRFATATVEAVCLKLKPRIKGSLFQNLKQNEVVKVVIIGAGGQAIVGTDTRLFVLKAGFLAGATFGAEVTSWSYRNLLGIQIHKGMRTGGVVVQAPGQTGYQTSYWGSGKDDLFKAPNAIPVAGNWPAVRAVVAELQNLIDAAHAPAVAAPPNLPPAQQASMADEMKKLSELHASGSLTDEEFTAAKKRLLGT